MKRAGCQGADPSLFHPDDREGNPYKKAREICVTCPVRQRCLDEALAAMVSDKNDDDDIAWGAHGMWGGTTPLERWRMLGKNWAVAS